MQDTQISHQSKEMSYLLYFTAISLSVVSAYYSIAGLTAIFAAAVIPIIVMGGVLEFSKLVVASWLYRSWKSVPFLMRTYFSVALLILMMLTSMGIFGFLSKAHLDQAVPTGDVAAKIAIIDEKIKTEKENINASRAQLKQLDSQVDQTIGRSEDSKGVERSLQIRRGQQKERSGLLAEIGSAQSRLSRLNEERAPIASELRKVEAEVGPIKYIAALLYGDNPDQGILEKAVRIVIIMIVIVFDPLAVLLLMAASMPIKKEAENEIREPNTEEETSSEENNFSSQTKESFNKIKERFFTKFSPKPREEPSLEQRITDIDTSDTISTRDDISIDSSSRSAGVESSTTDQSSTEIQELPKVIKKRLKEVDGAGRVIWGTHDPHEMEEPKESTDFVTDWNESFTQGNKNPKNS